MTWRSWVACPKVIPLRTEAGFDLKKPSCPLLLLPQTGPCMVPTGAQVSQEGTHSWRERHFLHSPSHSSPGPPSLGSWLRQSEGRDGQRRQCHARIVTCFLTAFRRAGLQGFSLHTSRCHGSARSLPPRHQVGSFLISRHLAVGTSLWPLVLYSVSSL